MQNVEKLKSDYELITNFWFGDRQVEGFKKMCNLCPKPADLSNTDGDVVSHYCYVPVLHTVFVFYRTTKKIKNKKSMTFSYLGYYCE